VDKTTIWQQWLKEGRKKKQQSRAKERKGKAKRAEWAKWADRMEWLRFEMIWIESRGREGKRENEIKIEVKRKGDTCREKIFIERRQK
jgi:hypothetical protein